MRAGISPAGRIADVEIIRPSHPKRGTTAQSNCRKAWSYQRRAAALWRAKAQSLRKNVSDDFKNRLRRFKKSSKTFLKIV
jgi:hypothetical protein